ncbi:hypothetical protein OsI_23867 [Oryza sativa Indica Group]|jgi:hypothetical protein|uniref:Uncharacterized protein n=5 Tax=Oryza TaxID=4527 RepID=Q67WV7_ORYSJ|nr:hypothetical protein OsI_23867 [Oryza sativa Indica Group]EAZ37787.1 hypothetical protein OsJ_22123 [Oryza sativa Japonica Group]BAD37362.1 hypothetical protein [Oryza sativa Japonica Group]
MSLVNSRCDGLGMDDQWERQCHWQAAGVASSSASSGCGVFDVDEALEQRERWRFRRRCATSSGAAMATDLGPAAAATPTSSGLDLRQATAASPQSQHSVSIGDDFIDLIDL